MHLIFYISDSAENILMETTCLVIKPPLITLKRNGTYGYVDLIEGLTNHGYVHVERNLVKKDVILTH